MAQVLPPALLLRVYRSTESDLLDGTEVSSTDSRFGAGSRLKSS